MHAKGLVRSSVCERKGACARTSCVRACVRACVCTRVRVYVRKCVHACLVTHVFPCACVRMYLCVSLNE